MEIVDTRPQVRFLGKPIRGPGDSNVRYAGGRLRHYGAMMREDSAQAATGAAASSAADRVIKLDDIVEVCPRVTELLDPRPFLAQVEAFWEDSFTGIAYCRARWLLRASEIPKGNCNVSEDEVLLTPVTDDIEAANILGLAPVTSTPAEPELCHPGEKSQAASPGTRRGLRPKHRSPRLSTGCVKRSKVAASLRLSRTYDPFSAESTVLQTDHPAMVQLRGRERDESSGGNGMRNARGRSRDVHGASRNISGGTGVVGAQRKGLRGARFLVAARRRSSAARRRRRRRSSSGSSSSGGANSSGGDGGYSSSSGCADAGGDSNSNYSSSGGGFTSEGSQDDLLDDDQDIVSSTRYPTTRRAPRSQAAAPTPAAASTVSTGKASVKAQPTAAADTPLSDSMPAMPATVKLPPRPRRLSIPPDDNSFRTGAASTSGSINGTKMAEAGGRKSLLRGGPLIRAAHAGDDSKDGLDSPEVERYPHKDTAVGEDHQADIPNLLLTEAERAADKETVETGEMGGTAVWRSVREWTACERERLDGFLDEARLAVEAKRMLPGVPALISINNSSDRRRKRKTAWAVLAGGEAKDEEKLRVACAGSDVLEVSRSALQPVQIEELAMHALMQEGMGKEDGKSNLMGDVRPALGLLNTMVEGSGPLATWTRPQIASLSEALKSNFDADRYTRSRGHERHRDEHTDVTSLIASVEGKTPSQVLSFYYRYMAIGDALTHVIGSLEVLAKTRPERKSTRPRTPPPPRPSPPPNLRHRASLRCPTRLAPSLEDSDSGGDSGGSYHPRTRRSSRNERCSTATPAAAAAVTPISAKGSDGRAAANKGRVSDSGGGSRPVTRQTVDRRASPPEDGTAPRGRGGDKGGEGGECAPAPACDGRPRAIVGGSSTARLNEAFGGRSVAWVRERGVSQVGDEQRGYKRSLEDHRGLADDGRVDEREPQRPRWPQEPRRPAIPADAVIVEVSDDEELVAAPAASADTNLSSSNGQITSEVSAPAYVGRSAVEDQTDHSHRRDTAYPHPRGNSSAFTGRSDERYVESRTAADPRHHYHDGPYNDYRYDDHNNDLHDRRQYHHRHNGNGYVDTNHRADGHSYGLGYSSSTNRGGGERHYAMADRYAHHPISAAGIGIGENGAPGALGRHVLMQEPQQQPGPAYNGDWMSGCGGGREAINGVCDGSVGDGAGSTDMFRRRHDDLSPMDKCWMLVDFARKDGLPPDRVEYLRGLLRTHEKKNMTFHMLAERTDSCLYDREDIQQGFLEIFGQMELPEPHRRTYRNDAVSPQASDNYATRGGYGQGSRSSSYGGHGHGSSGYPYSNSHDSSPYGHSGLSSAGGGAAAAFLHDEGMERVAAAVPASNALLCSVNGAAEALDRFGGRLMHPRGGGERSLPSAVPGVGYAGAE